MAMNTTMMKKKAKERRPLNSKLYSSKGNNKNKSCYGDKLSNKSLNNHKPRAISRQDLKLRKVLQNMLKHRIKHSKIKLQVSSLSLNCKRKRQERIRLQGSSKEHFKK